MRHRLGPTCTAGGPPGVLQLQAGPPGSGAAVLEGRGRLAGPQAAARLGPAAGAPHRSAG